MKFLIVPGNNSLSHLGKALALEFTLSAQGHEVWVAVSRQREAFVRHLGNRARILPDIQEIDQSGYPTTAWFRDPQRLVECLQAEVTLLKEIQPDRALGVFRFTLKASAQLAGVPFDSLACGCMLPETSEVLGFASGETGIDLQRESLRLFYGFAGKKISQALRSLGLSAIPDIRWMLKGERTFLWDFPAFSPLPELPGVIHVGPLPWNHWPHDAVDLERILAKPRPLALLTFGTCVGSAEVALRMVRILRSQGYQVVLAAGGQEELVTVLNHEPDVKVCRFAPLHLLMPHTALLACHGGQLSVFEALEKCVPVLVMPFQAEQAHNGVCLERIGCGGRLTPPHAFLGDPGVYVDAFNALTDGELLARVRALTDDSRTAGNRTAIQQTLAGYHGLETLTSSLVAG